MELANSACARVRVSEAHAHLVCVLCGGYFVDATTISECLHTFCKTCIVRHLETSKFCPICDVQLNKSRPLHSIRPDKIMQRLVYKVVPGLYQAELQRRKQFYSSADLQVSDTGRADCCRDLLRHGYYGFTPEDSVCLSLEYYDSSKMDDKGQEGKEAEGEEKIQRRYLQCPAAVTMHHLQKFLRMKYGLKYDHRVDIYFKKKLIPDHVSLFEVSYLYDWDRVTPMRFGFQILARHPIAVPAPTSTLVAENPPSSSLEDTALHSGPTRDSEEVRSEQSEPVKELGKKKLRENSSTSIPEESPAPMKKLRSSKVDVGRRKSAGGERTSVFDKTESVQVAIKSANTVRRVQELVESETIEDSNGSSDFYVSNDKEVGSQAASPGTEASSAEVIPDEDEVMEAEENSQAAESIENDNLVGDASQDIEEVVVDIEGEPSQDFILQDEQPMDISEDLEEDDDEDRLRICDPEEVPEERNNEENIEDQTEADVIPSPVEDGKVENYVEEETEVVRKEGKSRKKNKKAKHHHRHKRDYSPAPEATIVPNDKSNDCMKLKVKLTRADSETQDKKGSLKQKTKQDEIAKNKPNDNHAPSKHPKQTAYVVAEENVNNSIQSPINSNVDEDSRNSQSTDDHDVRSVASSKEGQDEVSQTFKGSPLHNGALDSAKLRNRELTNKERLLQMRQVRHKNITPPPSRAPLNTTISKVSAEEASKKSHKAPILLTSSSSSLTVSKVTAEEKMMMMTNNNLESKRPSLEIIMVNNPNAVNKNLENRSRESNARKILPGGPVVKLMKSNQMNSLLPKQNALSVSKVKNNVDGSGKTAVEGMKSVKDDKTGVDRGRTDKKPESFGALDLSGKSTRSSGSSPASEGSNCPSPNQTALSMSQPLINRHLAAMASPHRSSSNSPPVSASVPKDSPTRGLQHPASLWNLMTLTDTAVHIRNMKAAQAQDGMKRQLANNQKKPSPQRYPVVSPPAKSPSSRTSPTQLKIPTPNITLSSKFVNRPKLPNNPTTLSNSVRPVGVNKPLVGLTRPMPSASPGRPNSSYASMLSHSAAVAKKQAGINGRNMHIPPPPPAIPISSLFKMENMTKKYDLEKIARGLSAASKAAAGIPSS